MQAVAVSGRQTKKEKEQIFAAYERGRITVLVSCLLLIEGWDAPWTSCVVLARPATRAGCFVIGPQMIGRGLRLAANKHDCIILEMRDLKPPPKPVIGNKLPPEAVSLMAEAFEVEETELRRGEVPA